MPAAARVVRTYYALTGLFTLSGALIWGVNTLVMLDAGLTIVGAFTANAVFTASEVLLEIPTGVVADTRGRRFSFLMAAATLTVASGWVAWLAFTHAPLAWWLAANVLLGLGFTFYSGAVEAWFVDALHAAGEEGPFDRYFARGQQVFSAGMLVVTVAGGLVGTIDLALPWAVRAALLALLFGIGYVWMRDDGFTPRPFAWRKVPEEVGDIWRASIRHGWRRRPVRLLMMLTFLQMGFLIWGWYAWQPHFLALLDTDAIWIAGLIGAAVSASMMAGNEVVRRFGDAWPRPTVMLIMTAGLAASMIGVGLSQTFAPAVALFLAGMVCFGIVGPMKQAAFHHLIPSAQRATIVSFDALLGSAGGVGSQVALAKIADARGFAAGYLVGGAALALGVPIAWWYRRVRRSET